MKDKINTKSFIYGPVPSRRLGYSLGLDIVQYKVCTYDCIYCQIGKTTDKIIDRTPYIPADIIIQQALKKLNESQHPDFITIGGSGEPTLNSEIGLIINEIKKNTRIPLAVITNGSMFWDEQIVNSLMPADVILPSLDAYYNLIFEQINRPHPDINFEKMVNSLITFRKIYQGKIWLEIFLLDGINISEESAYKFKAWVEKINPDKVHLNTAVRPTSEKFAKIALHDDMEKFSKIIGEKAEIIVDIKREKRTENEVDVDSEILNIISRRPSTVEDIESILGISKLVIFKHIDNLVEKKCLDKIKQKELFFYQIKEQNRPL
ncbi:MAG: radical SAM protein [Desulfobacterales bacterium]|nr:radical SAM protein [Desulfobacterales bacterium]